jgi:predicted ferric reductase
MGHLTVSYIIRLSIFLFLNFLWGWNRIRFSSDYQLYGWLTIANGGLALLLAPRTNIFSIILRIPPPILLLYHRWIGRATFVHATIHMSLTIQKYIDTDQVTVSFASTRIRVGLMAWISLAVIFLTSLSIVRRRGFEIFYYAHFLFLVFLGGALYHASKGPEFLLPGAILWAIDRIIRFIHNFRTITIKSITHYPGDVTKFKFEGIKTTYPNQMAWIQIPSVSFFNWHPYTIASAPGHQTGTIAIRGLGGYSKRVLALSGARVETEEDKAKETTLISVPIHETASVKMGIDGPYGIDHLQWSRYSVIVLVAGGIGITPGISIASHIVNLAKASSSPGSSRHIHLLWSIKYIQHTLWFEEELAALAALAADPALPVTLDVDIHVTGLGTNVSRGDPGKKEEVIGTGHTYQGPGTICPGRPQLLPWFQKIKEMRPGLDAAVSICGPKGIADGARKAAASVSWEKSLFHVDEEQFQL